jgi:hypothetical protein
MVSRDVGRHQLEDRYQRLGAAAGVGLGQLANRVGVAAQAAARDGSAGPRSAVGPGGGRRDLCGGHRRGAGAVDRDESADRRRGRRSGPRPLWQRPSSPAASCIPTDGMDTTG